MLEEYPDIQQKLDQAHDDRERADILNECAWNSRYNNPNFARKLAVNARKLAESNEYRQAEGYSYRNSGVTSFLLGNSKSALEDAQSALKIFQKIDNKEGEASVHNLFGAVYLKLSKFNEALDHQHKSLNLLESAGDKKSAANVLTNIGNIYQQLSQYDTALEFHLKAVNISEELGDKRNAARTLNNISAIYFYLGHHETALKYLKKALPIFEEIDEYSGLAQTLGNIGLIFQVFKRYDESLECLVKSLQVRQKIGDKNGIAHAVQNMGNVYNDLGDHKSALEYQKKALLFFEQLRDKAGQASVHLNIAKILGAIENYEQAIDSCVESLSIAEEINDKELSFRVHEHCSSVYEKLKDFESSLFHYRRFSQIRDEVLNIEKQKAITAIEFRYDMERVEREKEIYRLKNVELASALVKIEQTNTALEEKTRSLEAAKEEIEVQQLETMKVNHELEVANEKLQYTNDQLRKVNNEKNEIMSIVAHDLKNPLTGVLLAADSMKQYLSLLTKRDILKYIDNIQGCSDSMMKLVSNLLDVRMLEDGKMHFERKLISLDDIAASIVDLYTTRANKKRINLHYSSEDARHLIIGDEERIREVIENLLSNALKYSPKQKDVWISLKSAGERVVCAVRDEGPGLTDDDKSRLFQKFVRLSAKPTGGESSSGLGLAISKKFVEEMNGRIWCESRFGDGATFGVEFPSANGVYSK